MPKATVPLLIKTMTQRGLVSAGTKLKTTTVYRFLHDQQLMKAIPSSEDRRKFEAELPNDLWQSDVMHGPMVVAEPRQKKSYLIAFIDDHSRLVPYARFYLSERLEAFLDAFEKAMLRRGLPRKLYVDNGSRSTWWKGVKEGRFPQPVKLAPRTTAWRASDIQKLVNGKNESLQ